MAKAITGGEFFSNPPENKTRYRMTINQNNYKNRLCFGDNLYILRDKIPDDSIDLIYLDPPFQSGRNYNQIFQPEENNVKGATAQVQAFEDTWYWGEEAETNYQGLINGQITKEQPNQKLIELMSAMRSYLGEVPMMAYLAMMAPRLLEMRRVLKETGSIYLHCDPTASHYLKLLMDSIFGAGNFRNEIVWHYRRWTARSNRFQRLHDIIFFYTKTDQYTFNQILIPYTEGSTYRKEHGVLHRFKEGEEPHLVSNKELQSEGVPANDVFQIPFVAPSAKERIGYPTQKPEKLLELIIKASSNDGDLILDPFCGCGTTVAVAQKLTRKWIGIDITYLAIDIIAKRLDKSGYKKGTNFDIEGEPTDYYSAEKLARQDPFQFEVWCVAKLNATPSPIQVGDKGVDGILNFIDPRKKDKAGKGIIQVKGTQTVNPSMIRDLKGTVESQNAAFGVLILLKKPTQGMISEAVKSGYYNWGYSEDDVKLVIPKIQIITIEDLFQKPLPLQTPPIISPYQKPEINQELEIKRLFN